MEALRWEEGGCAGNLFDLTAKYLSNPDYDREDDDDDDDDDDGNDICPRKKSESRNSQLFCKLHPYI